MTDFLDDPTLISPDADTDSKYNWDKEFQRHIIALLVSDRQFLLQSIDLIKPSYFTEQAHSKICKITFEFFKKYRILPRKDFIIQEMKNHFKDSKALPHFLGETNVIFDYFQPGLESREYLQDKITYFAKIQSLKDAFTKSLELIDKAPESEDTWNSIYEKMRTAMNTSQNFEIGMDYFKSIKDRYAKKNEEEGSIDRFICNFPSIDMEIGGGGFSRGEVIAIVAPSGVGKSLCLACITAANLLRGKRGVYITLEMAEEKVADRMDAILTGFPVQNLIDNKDDIFEKLGKLNNVSYEGEIWPLVIKKFPSGTASVNTIRAYLAQLRFSGFDPDFVIVDYVGEMADIPDLKIHESREKIVKGLRCMADEEQVFVATALQPNREGSRENKNERARLTEDHLADSFGQIRPLDMCLSLMQNDNEKLLGIGRGYLMKLRDGNSRFQIFLKFDKQCLRITEITRDEYMRAMNAHKELVSQDVKIDQVKKAWKPSKEEEVDDNWDTTGME